MTLKREISEAELDEAARKARNFITLSGSLNYTLNEVMRSNEPDGIFNLLGSLSDAAIAAVLKEIRNTQ
jgi:hypothetical protein